MQVIMAGIKQVIGRAAAMDTQAAEAAAAVMVQAMATQAAVQASDLAEYSMDQAA